MGPFFMSLFVLLFSLFSLAEGDAVVCGFPNDMSNNSTHLVPFMKMEKEGDHVKVTVLETEWQEEISENLYFYWIPSNYVNEGLYSGTLANFDGIDIEQDEDGYPLEKPSRIGLAPEQGRLITLSNVYNQYFYIWGEYSLVNFAFDPKGEDYVGLQYNSPIDNKGRRLVGGTYYCNEDELDQLFWRLQDSGAVTTYETPEGVNEVDDDQLGLDFELLKYTEGIFCSKSVTEYRDAYGERYDRCPSVKRQLLWVLKFMEKYNHDFSYDKLQNTIIYFDDNYYNEGPGWQTDERSGRKYLALDSESSKRELMWSLKKYIDGNEGKTWFH